MKKIFGLLAILALTLGAFAQGTTQKDFEFGKGESVKYFDGTTASASIGIANDSIFTYTVKKISLTKSLPLAVVNIDRVAVGGTIQTILYGKSTDNNPTWVGLDTVTFRKSAADTTFFLDPSTFGIRDYYKIQVKGSGATVKGMVDFIDFKIVEE